MRALIQRVTEASVTVEGAVTGAIGPGLLVLLGVEPADSSADVEWLAGKLVNLRIFADDAGAMNRSVLDLGGGILVVSQFTLFASTRKGNRPSFTRAAPPEQADRLYQELVAKLAGLLGRPVPTGRFGAHMEVRLLNDGPVTVMIDTRARE